jgi:hypothetical protein
VPPAPSLPGVAHTKGCTTVYAVAELFAEFGSPVRETVAVFVNVLAEAGAVTVIAILAVAPMGIADVMEQEIVLVPLQDHPADGVTDTNVTPAGSVSVRTLDVTGAFNCPRF